MVLLLENLHVRSRQQWRAWLQRHHASSPGVWFVFYKKHAAMTSIPYEDAVREALCFGWIDSLVKRLDDDRFVLKFTPRKPASKWSDSNRKRWAELEAAGALAPAGLAAAPTANCYAPKPRFPRCGLHREETEGQPQGRAFFFRRCRPTGANTSWIHIAKRRTREKRLRESVTLLAAREQLGLK
jgi:hypothetical protein